jgi:cysteinyl-tRNA synthetase
MRGEPLYLYNSLEKKLQLFEPYDHTAVKIYSCGPTVYHYAHIGNLRAYLFTDLLRRTLQWKGYNVLHVINITDVGHLTSDGDSGEDKMELATVRTGRTIWEVAEYYTSHFFQDLISLNILSPSIWCKATDHIQEMIAFALECEARG